MILFVNIFVEKEYATKYDRGLARTDSRIDVAKYLLASLEVLNFSRVFINVELETQNIYERTEFQKFILELYPDCKFRSKRVLELEGWLNQINEITQDAHSSEPVMYIGLDDHIFIDKDLEVIEACLMLMKQMERFHPYVYVELTDHVDALFNENFQHGWRQIFAYGTSCSAHYGAVNNSSIAIISQRLLKKIFLDAVSTKGMLHKVRRTDELEFRIDAISIRPHRELFKHYDTTGHTGNSCFEWNPLIIPKGFFESDIRIVQGIEYFPLGEPKDKFTLVDPVMPHESEIGEHGSTMRCTIQNIPLAWKARISQVLPEAPVFRNGSLFEDELILDRYSRQVRFDKGFIPELAPMMFSVLPKIRFPFSQDFRQSLTKLKVFKEATGSPPNVDIVLLLESNYSPLTFMTLVHSCIGQAVSKFSNKNFKVNVAFLGKKIRDIYLEKIATDSFKLFRQHFGWIVRYDSSHLAFVDEMHSVDAAIQYSKAESILLVECAIGCNDINVSKPLETLHLNPHIKENNLSFFGGRAFFANNPGRIEFVKPVAVYGRKTSIEGNLQLVNSLKFNFTGVINRMYDGVKSNQSIFQVTKCMENVEFLNSRLFPPGLKPLSFDGSNLSV